MPKETIYGGEQFVFDRKTGNEWPLLDTPDQSRGEPVCQRGISVHWGKDTDSVEIGVSMIQSITGEHFHADGQPFPGAFTHLDQSGLVHLIRMLKRAGRQAFGDVPW